MTDLSSELRRIYGDDPHLLAEQEARYARGLAAFAARYGPGEAQAFHAPGRVNLIGEHTDYNHGYVLPMALDKDVLLYVRPRADATVRLANIEPDYAPREFIISGEIARRPVGDWANYAQGPAQLLAQEHGPQLRGFDALVDGAPPHGVPRGAGLSSSSALTVVSAVALAALNDLPLAGAALADACGRAEWYVGTRGGIMDQFISILARRGHALFLDCRPSPEGAYTFRHVSIPQGYTVMVVDSGVRHRNTGPHFNRRVAEGRIGARLLRERWPEVTHLRDVERLRWAEIEPLLPEVIHADELRARGMDPDTILDRGVSAETDTFCVRRRCRHVVSENMRVLESVMALEAGDMIEFADLLAEAHASARDDYEISVPEIEALREAALAAPGCIGARLTGAGWGGCIVAVVESARAADFAPVATAGYRRATGLEARVFACHSAAGAGLVARTTV